MRNQQTVTDKHISMKSVVERCDRASSALARLSFSAEQLDALRTQGFVHQERRAGGESCFKLRFRFRGKQLVRCLGKDPARAELIRDALAQHQVVHRKLRRLARDTQQANRMVREAKKKLLPYVERLGYKFHGFDLRMQRGAEPLGKEVSPASASSHHFVTDKDLNPMENVNHARNDDEKTVNVDLPLEEETEVQQESVGLAATSNLRPQDTEIARRQMMRLQEYLTDCLALPNAEEAMLGTTAGGLMRVAFRLSDSIDAVLEEGFDNKGVNESLIWGIEALLRVSRLIEKLTQLRMHLSNARSALKQLTDSRK